MDNPALRERYLSILDSPPPSGRQKEQVVQEFLEEHSELIPTPNLLNHHLHFRSIISKCPLGTGLITDYVYLTKSSDTWRITMVELESPDKEFFQKTARKVAKTAQFNAAIDQVRSWKQYADTHSSQIKESLLSLLQPPGLRENPIEYHFQLIYGRSSNKNLSLDRKREFRALQRDLNVTILTFDQIISLCEISPSFKKNILRHSSNGFSCKSMEAGPSHILAHLGPGEFFLTQEQMETLAADGYDMEAWRRGELLVVNDRHPKGRLDTIFGASFGTPKHGA